ncbi:MAG: hypothetical protein ACRDT4_06565 [Micromonosporaceae bacterium]
MRHFLSLLAGLVIAPAVWIATGLGQVKLSQAMADGGGSGAALTAVAILAAAGLIVGLIASTRISPLGPLVAGLLLLGGQLLYVYRPTAFPKLGSTELLSAPGGMIIIAPATTGLAAVLGTSLVVALLSIGRWRKWPKYEQPDDTFLSDSAAPIGAPTPAGARQSFGADDPIMAGRPLGREEPTRAFAGTPPAGADQSRYEAFGYVSDEPTRPAPPWPESHEPAWRPGADLDEGERTTRLPGAADSGGPWTEPPRR